MYRDTLRTLPSSSTAHITSLASCTYFRLVRWNSVLYLSFMRKRFDSGRPRQWGSSVLQKELELELKERHLFSSCVPPGITSCLFLSVPSDHMGLTWPTISNRVSLVRLYFTFALSRNQIGDELDSGICCTCLQIIFVSFQTLTGCFSSGICRLCVSST